MKSQSDNKKVISLAIETAKLSDDILKSVIQDFLDNPSEHGGEKKLKQLVSEGAELKNIEVTAKNIGNFKKIACKYGITFGIKKDDSILEKPKYIVSFKGRDIETVNKAFKEYAYKQTTQTRFSKKKVSRIDVEQSQAKGKSLNKNRNRKKEHQRSI